MILFFLLELYIFFSIVQDGRTALHYSCANANAMRLGSMLASKGLDATVIGKKMFQTIYSLLDNAPSYLIWCVIQKRMAYGMENNQNISLFSYR